jgi:hypothetical protein
MVGESNTGFSLSKNGLEARQCHQEQHLSTEEIVGV